MVPVAATPNRRPLARRATGRIANRELGRADPARWYVPRALGEEIATRSAGSGRAGGRWAKLAALAAALALAVALGACGGDDGERQDADEPSAEFPLEVGAAQFPTRQRLAETSDLRLEITNAGAETVPDLAVTIWTGDEKASAPFSIRSDQPGLADPNTPVWVLEHGYPKLLTEGIDRDELDDAPSAGAEAAQTNTFSFGALAPDETRDIVWRVTPVQAGTYTVHYELAAGLGGNARAVTEDGSPVEGEFVVTITDRPPRARVNDAGQVEIEER